MQPWRYMNNVSPTGIWNRCLRYAPSSERQARHLGPSSGLRCSGQTMNAYLSKEEEQDTTWYTDSKIITLIPARNQAGVLSLFIWLNRYTCRNWQQQMTSAYNMGSGRSSLHLPAELTETHFLCCPHESLHPAWKWQVTMPAMPLLQSHR